MIFPLKNYNHPLPLPPEHVGAFGAVRRFDVHTGVDLYCNEGDEVLSMEEGVVEEIFSFTGKHAGSPWWNDTFAVLIRGKSGYLLYGEIQPEVNIKRGLIVSEGQLIGTVATVLKKDKGLPMSMLHMELYNHHVKDPVIWGLDGMKPEGLEDPTTLLKEALGDQEVIEKTHSPNLFKID